MRRKQFGKPSCAVSFQEERLLRMSMRLMKMKMSDFSAVDAETSSSELKMPLLNYSFLK